MSFLDYLIPSQIQTDIKSLMRQDYSQDPKMSKDKFVEQYWKKGYNPVSLSPGKQGDARSRHYIQGYDYDPDYVTLPTQTVEGGTRWGADREKTGFKFHGSESATQQEAYDLYLEQWNAKQTEGTAYNVNPNNVDFLDNESLLSSLQGVGKPYLKDDWGEGYDKVTPESIRGFNVEDFRGLHSEFYNPYVTQERNPLEASLSEKRKTARASGGDFSGYGRRSELEDVSEGSYLQGVGDIYANVDEAKSNTLKDIYSNIGGIEDLVDRWTA